MDETIDKQINEMLKSTSAESTEAPGTDAPGTTAPGTEAPMTKVAATESPATEAPATAAPSTEAPGTDAPKTTAPTTAAPEEDVDKYKRENDELRKRIDELSGPKTMAPKTSAPSTDIPLSEVDFVKDLDMDELARDPKELNKLLNKVYGQGVNTTRKVFSESVLKSLPDTISDNVRAVIALREATDEFYKDNEDLKPFKKVVAAVFDDIVSDHPDWDHSRLIKESGIETRKRLELKKVNEKKPNDKRKPTLPRKKGQQRQTQQKTNADPVLAEIDEMNEVV